MIGPSVTNPLPSEQEPGQLAESSEALRATPRLCGVLIADDEGGLRGVLGVALRQEGFAVWLAASGREALDLYRSHREAIDMVLLDVLMPGLDGPETLAALQELNPQIRCCFMSGDLGGFTGGGLRHLGAAAVLQKPFLLTEVAQVLRQLANDGRGEPVQPVSA